MSNGEVRASRIQDVLRATGLDALACALPANVLLLSGYWPVVGSALAVVTREGQVALLVPEDEQDLAARGWATEVRSYQPGSLARLTGPAEAIRVPLAMLLRDLGVESGRIGYEAGDAYEPAGYAALYLYGGEGASVLAAAAPEARLVPASTALAPLRASLTADEVARVRLACEVAAVAFTEGARALRPGVDEAMIAATYQAPLSIQGLRNQDVARAGGFVYCMSGPNAALAGGAFARTRARTVQEGDLILVHCNSYIEGYWTDITRTYCLGTPDERRQAMYAAVLAAHDAALAAIHPGSRAADVDRAARQVLAAHGFGAYFTHGLGHNVGFSAISTEFAPRLHPASNDSLEIGMTFNLEPAIYIKGYGGIRHCDVVTLTAEGPEILTPFQASLDQLTIDR